MATSTHRFFRLPVMSLLALCASVTLVQSCRGNRGFTKGELRTIASQGDVMRVLTVDVAEDSLVLRTPCKDFPDKALRSSAYRSLVKKMVATVTDPGQDGVGIAGPQIGLSRRIVAVQRFDKPGEPFEVYPNIRIESFSGEVTHGQEGCLSVPGKRGPVPRYSKIVVSYKDPESLGTVRDTVEGFTAIIFQHEADHLDGVLYTDKADSLFVNGKK